MSHDEFVEWLAYLRIRPSHHDTSAIRYGRFMHRFYHWTRGEKEPTRPLEDFLPDH